MVALKDDVAVHCHGVIKTYGTGGARVTALRGVDLEVRAGELLMLVGPSGCGKTTLISVIAGILDRDEGHCRVFGQDFQAMRQRERTRRRGRQIGFVFQAFNLLPTLTAAENVAIPLLINGLGRRAALTKARDLLDRVGLGSRTHSLPAELSGGQ
ncbi:MAG: ATP-binding cassette domain-containing protein, partial [Planctomycetes bacterium]|nr:ATP-binding cassette domain-containing protein [Planctomycetota bacterium]